MLHICFIPIDSDPFYQFIAYLSCHRYSIPWRRSLQVRSLFLDTDHSPDHLHKRMLIEYSSLKKLALLRGHHQRLLQQDMVLNYAELSQLLTVRQSSILAYNTGTRFLTVIQF